MPAPQPRGRYAKGVERRQQIVNTATDVFATAGFEGTALKRVADLVGVREATLFHYFTSKQELLTAVLEERDRRSGRDVAARYRHTLDALPEIAARNTQQPGLTTLYAVASATANAPGHASHSYFRDRFAAVVQDVAAGITERQQAGTLRSDLPADLMARLVVAVSDGLQLQWLYDKNVDMPGGLEALINVAFAPAGPPRAAPEHSSSKQ
jgi:AcrR family transcriptional regulator